MPHYSSVQATATVGRIIQRPRRWLVSRALNYIWTNAPAFFSGAARQVQGTETVSQPYGVDGDAQQAKLAAPEFAPYFAICHSKSRSDTSFILARASALWHRSLAARSPQPVCLKFVFSCIRAQRETNQGRLLSSWLKYDLRAPRKESGP